MATVSCHAVLCCYVVNYTSRKNSKPLGSKLPIARENRRVESVSTSSGYSHLCRLRLVSVPRGRSLSFVKRCGKTFNSYVLDGEVGVSSVTGDCKTNILIPSLPDGDNTAQIRRHLWEWRPKLNVSYETSGSENGNSPSILLLPGFGVGSFHYKKQLEDLGCDYRVWALDFLGQGLSLPQEDPTSKSKDGNVYSVNGESDTWGFGDESETWAEELVYSVDLWKDQVQSFVEEVIKEPVYVVGNSLGGFVALYVAACNPELVKGVTLLNATPFWAFLPNPERSPMLSRLFPWAGTFPLPSSVRKLVEILWQKISDPRSISEILSQVYKDHTTDVDEVFSRIMETTRHPAAAASLASIMFAPRGKLSFKEALSRCQTNKTPICLTYGKDDPWVMPICGWQVKRQVPDALYYEISPAGHCPHDEVPEVVNFLLRGWIKNLESKGSVSLPLLEDSKNELIEIVRNLEFSRKGSRKSVRVEFHGSDLSIWNWLRSQFKPQVPKITKFLQNKMYIH